MAKREITIEYSGGERVTATPKVVHLIAAEEKYGKDGHTPPLKGALYAAWLFLGRPNGRFDSWLERIDNVLLDEDEDDDGPPPAAAGSDGT